MTVAALPGVGVLAKVSVPPSATAPPSDEETAISGAPDAEPLAVMLKGFSSLSSFAKLNAKLKAPAAVAV